MECRLAASVPSDSAWQFIPPVADFAFEDFWRTSEVVEQCFAELSHLAAVEADDGGVCVLERGC